MSKKKIGVLLASNRNGSFSNAIWKKMKEYFVDYELEEIDIHSLEFYQEDLEGEQAPKSWKDFRTAMGQVSGLIIVSPEYNRSMPAVIKNALDVGSRPMGENVFDQLPAAIVTVSPGALGGFGANHHLRQVLTFLNVATMQQPEIYVGNVLDILDDSLNVVGEDNVKFLEDNVKAIEKWFNKINK